MVNLAAGLCELGVQVDLVVANATGPFVSEVADGVALVDLESPRTIVSAPRLIRYLRRSRPDALLSTLNHANVVAIAGAALSGSPTRIFVREANTASISVARASSRRAKVIPWLMRALYPRAAGVIAPSHGVAQDLQAELGLARVAVIENPVITPALHERAQEAADHPYFDDDVPVVLGVGRLEEQKDFATLLRAFRMLRAEREVRLIILGEGTRRAKLERLTRELGVEGDVSLPGFVSNPFAYMARARAFALSSRWEGLPNVLIQALACGCPAAATDCESGPREILRGGEVGPLVPMGDPSALAEGLRIVLDKPPAARLLRDAVQRFTAEEIAKRYLACMRGDPPPTSNESRDAATSPRH